MAEITGEQVASWLQRSRGDQSSVSVCMFLCVCEVQDHLQSKPRLNKQLARPKHTEQSLSQREFSSLCETCCRLISSNPNYKH